MLAAIILNLQDVQPQPPKPLPRINIDRGGGGGGLGQRYELADYLTALSQFPERAGEHPVARAARRQRFLEEFLPLVKEMREKRDAVVFLAGAEIGRRAAVEAAAEAKTAEAATAKPVDVASVIAAYDSWRAEQEATRRSGRGGRSELGAGGVLVIGGALLIAVALARR